MFYCCYASFLNILLEDIYYNGPENDLASTSGDQNSEGIQNTPSEILPTISTTQAPGIAEPPTSTTVAVGILPTLDNASAAAAPTTVPQTSHILPSSGRPQRRTNQTGFNLDKLRKCTCDVNAEVHPDGGVIQCKNTACVTKWVRDCFYFILQLVLTAISITSAVSVWVFLNVAGCARHVYRMVQGVRASGRGRLDRIY